MSNAYVYNLDSELMSRTLQDLEPGENFLEIGVGNGGNLRTVSEKFGLVVASDVADLNYAKTSNPSTEFVRADRANCFRALTFDVIAFNPPYLPTEGVIDRTVDGGRDGIEIPIAFVESSIGVLKNNGRILVLLSSQGDIEGFKNYCQCRSLLVSELSKKSLFFETLFVFELRKVTKEEP